MYAAQERILFTTPLLQRVGSLSRRTAALLQRVGSLSRRTAALLQREGSLSRKWGFLLQRKRFVFLSFLRRRRGGPFCPLPDGHPGFPRSASGYLGRKCLHLLRHIVVRCFLPKISGCLFNKKLTIQQFFIA